MEVENKVKTIMINLFNETITDDFDKFSTGKWDSFMHLDLIVAIEEEFNISFTPDEIGSIGSFKDIVSILKGKYEK
ncbi:MAG: acyl carrier protein [Bacilli bacterium]|nr:acyl carrier protein [Bacilli bacterium]MDD4809216.1 acyl carrier protein [Bacilli bacterium]